MYNVGGLLEANVDWNRHYNALIARARERFIEGYSELHHIVPRCMGGDDRLSNLVRLTPEEHFIAHLLLVKMYPGNRSLVYAAELMTIPPRAVVRRPQNKLCGWLKRRAAEVRGSPEVRQAASERCKADPRIVDGLKKAQLAVTGVPRTEEVKMKVSMSHKTSLAATKARADLNERKRGVPRSAETKLKIGTAHKGRPQSEAHKAAISAALKGKPKSLEHNAKVSAALTGKSGTRLGATTPEATKQKQREAAQRRYYPDGNVPPPRVVDPVRSASAYRRWAKTRAQQGAQVQST